jgi:MFS family permease
MTSRAHTPPRQGQSLVLAAVCLAATVLPLSFSGGAMATPAIGRDLGGTPQALTWITNAFMLSFGSLLMAAGTLADRYGRRRVFGMGLGLFSLSSLALACATGIYWLDGLRAIQGIAAAAALSSGSAALAQEFEGHSRSRAFALLGSSFGLGLAFGPMIAGALVASLGWRAVFALISGIAALAMLFGLPRMRETRDPDATGLDWPGAITFTAMLTLLTFGIIQAPASGWGSPWVTSLLIGAGTLLVFFIVIESRVRRPMLDLSLFRYPRFIGVQLLPIGTCYCYIVLIVVLPIRFIGVEGMGEMHTGWLMLALSAPMLFMPLAAAKLAAKISPGTLSGFGFLIAAAGLYWLSCTSFDDTPMHLAMPLMAIGMGTGLPWGLMDGLSVSVVPKERAGMATGIFSTTRVAGESIALALVGALLAWSVQSGLHRLMPPYELSADLMATASQRLSAGELLKTSATLHFLPLASLKQIYIEAFQTLLQVLAVVTVTCGVVVLGVFSTASAQLKARKQDGETDNNDMHRAKAPLTSSADG